MVTNENLILLHRSFESADEIITEIAKIAEEQGLVDETYLPAMIVREKEYPTGLPFPLPVAMPHIDTGVKEAFVGVATLNEPVTFMSMDRSGEELPVQIAFVFGIIDPNAHLEILKKFAVTFQNRAKIEELLAMDSEADFIKALDETLGGMLAQ